MTSDLRLATMPAMRILGRLSLIALCAASLQAQNRTAGGAQPTTVVGTVTDSTGRPLNGAEVRLIADDTEVSLTKTDDEGRFIAVGILQGRSKLQVRRLGFRAKDVELFFPRDSARRLLIQLESAARELEGVEVRGISDAEGPVKGFYERRQSNTYGHYFTREQILRRQPQFLSEMLRTVPGVTIARARTGGFRPRMRGCRYAPMIWIDGTRAVGAELDEVAMVDEVAAMEVYTTSAGVPAQYLDRSNVGCGTILLWTRLD